MAFFQVNYIELDYNFARFQWSNGSHGYFSLEHFLRPHWPNQISVIFINHVRVLGPQQIVVPPCRPTIWRKPPSSANKDTLWWTNIAMENGHRNSGFSHEKWWFSIAILVHQRVVILGMKQSSSNKNSVRQNCWILESEKLIFQEKITEGWQIIDVYLHNIYIYMYMCV